MFEISITGRFSAAHAIKGYRGECANLHGHNYKVEAMVLVEKVNEIGLGYDFREFKNRLNEILSSLDHHNLNELEAFSRAGETGNPSSENLARYIFERLSGKIEKPLRLGKITVTESEGASVTYYPSN